MITDGLESLNSCNTKYSYNLRNTKVVVELYASVALIVELIAVVNGLFAEVATGVDRAEVVAAIDVGAGDVGAAVARILSRIGSNSKFSLHLKPFSHIKCFQPFTFWSVDSLLIATGLRGEYIWANG